MSRKLSLLSVILWVSFSTLASANDSESWCSSHLASLIKSYDGGSGPRVDLKKFQEEAHNILSGFMGQLLPKKEAKLWFQDGVIQISKNRPDSTVEEQIIDYSSLIYTLRLSTEILVPQWDKLGIRLGLVMRADGTLSPMLLYLKDGDIGQRYSLSKIQFVMAESLTPEYIAQVAEVIKKQFLGVRVKIDDHILHLETDDIPQFFGLIRWTGRFGTDIPEVNSVAVDDVVTTDSYTKQPYVTYAQPLSAKEEKQIDFAKLRTVSKEHFPKLH